MAIELRVPALGESITQATVGNWLKKEGEAVQADEPVVEVESEKATVALPAPAAGVLRKILKASGTNVAVGEVIGELEAGAVAATSTAKPSAAPTTTATAKPTSTATAKPTSTPTPTSTSTSTPAPTATLAGRENGAPRAGGVRAP